MIEGLRERYEQVVVEDKGNVFNTDLTQALELGCCLELASCMLAAASRARRAAAPTRARTTSRRATTRTSSSTRSCAGSTAQPQPQWAPGDDHQVAARREDVLMKLGAQDLALDSASGERELKRVRGRRAGGGDAARRASTSSRTGTTARSPTARAAG